MDKKKQASDYASKTIHLSHGEDIDDEALVHNIRFMAFLAGWDACEQDRDRLKKQNEIMRNALQRIRELNEGLNENWSRDESFLAACELANQALKAAEEVEE